MKKLLMGILILLSTFCLMSFTNDNIVSAYNNKIYTDPVDDLSKDKTFNISKYPERVSYDNLINEPDKLCEFISIGESKADELYIYTYQPYNEYKGKNIEFKLDSIAMSTEETADGTFKPGSIRSYDLEYCNNNNAIYKYVVEDFKVTKDRERFYNITQLWRPSLKDFDSMIGGSIDQKKSIEVSEYYCCYYVGDKLTYKKGEFKTIELKPIYTGSFRFEGGLTIDQIFIGNFKAGDSHFICFNAEDYVIKHIYDADILFEHRWVEDRRSSWTGNKKTYGPWERENFTLYDYDEVSYKGDGWLAKEYTWNRISSSKDFLENYKKQAVYINPSVEEKIKSSQWVFSFYETNYRQNESVTPREYDYIEVKDVTILRLHFRDILDNEYDLGVVMDKTTPDNRPDGGGNQLDTDKLKDILRWLLLIIGIIAFVAICGPFIPMLISFIITIIKFVIKGIVWLIKGIFKIITWPFRKINEVSKKRKEKKRSEETYGYYKK